MKGLLVDYGGVLTTNVFASFQAFCTDEGIDPNRMVGLFRSSPEALAAVRSLEKGELSEDEFAELLGGLLGLDSARRAGMVDRMFGHINPDEVMVEAVAPSPRAAASERA